jgi:hypothetical protein
MCPRFASVIQPDYAPKRWVVLGSFPNNTGLVVVMGREDIGDMKQYQEYRAKAMKLLKECVGQ